MVAHGHARDTRTNFHDNTGALVTTDDGEETLDAHERPHFFGRNHVSGDEMLIAVAQTSGLPVHDDLAGLGRMDLDLFDLPFLIKAPQDRGLRLTDTGHD